MEFAFKTTTVPNFPFAVKPINGEINIEAFEIWCETALGAKLSTSNSTGRWFQSKGVFFFNTSLDVQRFVKTAKALESQATIMANFDPAFFRNVAEQMEQVYSR